MALGESARRTPARSDPSERCQVYAFTAEPDALRNPLLLRACWAMLGADERARVSRLCFERDRHRSLLGYALLRTSLSRFDPVPAESWVFSRGRHGRPEVATPVGSRTLRFNLSHTSALVACAVTRHRDIGVDVEDLRGRFDPEKLARRFCAPEERAALRDASGEALRERFLASWTLKEAYLKARGLGLRLPLEQLAFTRGPGGVLRARFGPAVDDDPVNWRFRLMRPTQWHVMALAARAPAEPDVLLDMPTSWREAADGIAREADLRGNPTVQRAARVLADSHDRGVHLLRESQKNPRHVSCFDFRRQQTAGAEGKP